MGKAVPTSKHSYGHGGWEPRTSRCTYVCKGKRRAGVAKAGEQPECPLNDADDGRRTVLASTTPSRDTIREWLYENTNLKKLSGQVLQELANGIVVKKVRSGDVLCREGERPDEIYVVRKGMLETKFFGVQEDVPPSSILMLTEVLREVTSSCSLEACTDAEVWAIPSSYLKELAARKPELALMLSVQLADQLAMLNEKQRSESEKQKVLRRYYVQPTNESFPQISIDTFAGKSRYFQNLRKQLLAAANDSERNHVLVFGEPGLFKDKLAQLIHENSVYCDEPVVMLQCKNIKPGAPELFGDDNNPGLLKSVGRGSIILNNVQDIHSDIVDTLFSTLDSAMCDKNSDDCQARLLFISEKTVPALSNFPLTRIKVPPLRLARRDIPHLVNFYLQEYTKHRGLEKVPTITPEVMKDLEAFDHPDNFAGLFYSLRRAVIQTEASPEGSTIGRSTLWFTRKPEQNVRLNLLDQLPILRKFLRSDIWPERINFDFTLYAFAAIVLILWFGPQERDTNFALNFFWAWWWPGIFLVYLGLGRVWCAVCPFMIYGELVQRWRLSKGAVLRKWPKNMDAWGPWFLFWMFAAILVWEECWDLPDTAYLSGWLLVLITAGAMICSYFFEKRLWCRYLCPIGGMNAMFAKLSVTELRAKQGVCTAECDTYHCYKGGPAEPPEGLETNGCPLGSHPAQLKDNKDCVLCMECLKACPYRSVEFNLRVPFADLLEKHNATASEVSLMFLLLGASYLHRLPALLEQFGLQDLSTEEGILSSLGMHMLVSSFVLAAPGLLVYAVDSIFVSGLRMKRGGDDPVSKASSLRKPATFVELAYGYLPLVWAITLAFYTELGLSEAFRVLQVAGRTIGLSPEVAERLPGFSLQDSDTLAVLQTLTLMTGLALSVFITKYLSKMSWKECLPHFFLLGGLTLEAWLLDIPGAFWGSWT
uniref:Cyclic nucleotide-binding domain-containing protein n=1 Tax=Picocystis salinarum TaxID=88271 RepID=A0A7S3UCU1_9CHLO